MQSTPSTIEAPKGQPVNAADYAAESTITQLEARAWNWRKAVARYEEQIKQFQANPALALQYEDGDNEVSAEAEYQGFIDVANYQIAVVEAELYTREAAAKACDAPVYLAVIREVPGFRFYLNGSGELTKYPMNARKFDSPEAATATIIQLGLETDVSGVAALNRNYQPSSGEPMVWETQR